MGLGTKSPLNFGVDIVGGFDAGNKIDLIDRLANKNHKLTVL